MTDWNVGDRVEFTSNGRVGTVKELDVADVEQPVGVEWDSTEEGYVYLPYWPVASQVRKVSETEDGFLLTRPELVALVGSASNELLRKLILSRKGLT